VRNAGLAAGLALLAGGCAASAPTSGTSDLAAAHELLLYPDPGQRARAAALQGKVYGPAEVAAMFADRTTLSYSRAHGNQVEHTSADGRAFLWYPGNARVLPGRWKVENGRICYAYEGVTLNPVTGAQGPGYECELLWRHEMVTVETVAGDPLGLSRRTEPPGVLPQHPGLQSVEQLRRSLGR
jgi:hypothetical protein